MRTGYKGHECHSARVMEKKQGGLKEFTKRTGIRKSKSLPVPLDVYF